MESYLESFRLVEDTTANVNDDEEEEKEAIIITRLKNNIYTMKNITRIPGNQESTNDLRNTRPLFFVIICVPVKHQR
jgi:hypothetical protein